jgi:hypothetical protein
MTFEMITQLPKQKRRNKKSREFYIKVNEKLTKFQSLPKIKSLHLMSNRIALEQKLFCIKKKSQYIPKELK